MKLGMAGLVGTMVIASMSVGCGPGLGHHGRWAKANAPSDAVGTATLSSEQIPLPASRMSVAQWEEGWAADEPAPELKTWGAPPKPEDRYGF